MSRTTSQANVDIEVNVVVVPCDTRDILNRWMIFLNGLGYSAGTVQTSS